MNLEDPTLVGRYLSDQLTPQERTDFEAAVQRNPDLLGELEATARLKVGLARLRESGQLEGLLKESPRLRMTRWLPLVAALAAVVIGVSLWRSTPKPTAATAWLARAPELLTTSSGRPLPVTASIAVFRKRGGFDGRVSIPQGPGTVQLRVLPTAGGPSAHYRLRLAAIQQGESQDVVGSVEDLVPATDGFVTAYADASHLALGRYKLTISDMGSSGATQTETFEIELTRSIKK